MFGSEKMTKDKFSPFFIITASFMVVILIGFILLMLPISTRESITWIDALFTSVSAVCVTGLSPVTDVSETFTGFGYVVIAILIQIGGLGFVTIAMFFLIIFGSKIGVNDRFLIKEALNQNSYRGVVKLVISIIKLTLVFEFLAFVCNLFVFVPDYGVYGIGVSIFHAISTFNNAGFDILGATSMIQYSDNILFNLSTSVFIILGGLGFIVIKDIIEKKSWKNLSIHSKIVLKVSFTLVVGGMLLIKFSEGLTSEITWLEAFFQSVTTRTAGFATVNFANLNELTVMVLMLLMFIGASPSSTGGGIKTTTFYTMIKSLLSFARGKRTIIYNREIKVENKNKAFMLAMLAVSCVFVMSAVIFAIEIYTKTNFGDLDSSTVSFTAIMFESVSAFGTVGLSMGITPSLAPLSKLVICVLMFFGRLGPLTILSIWNRNYNCNRGSEIKYLEEKIIIG